MSAKLPEAFLWSVEKTSELCIRTGQLWSRTAPPERLRRGIAPCLLGVQAGLDPLHLLEAQVAQGAVSVLSPSQRHPGSVVASGDHG